MDKSRRVDMTALLAVLKGELDKGVRVIHIWESHDAAESFEIAFGPELNRLIRQYGHPVYVQEDPSSDIQSLLDQLRDGIQKGHSVNWPQERAMATANIHDPEMKRYLISRSLILERFAEGADVILPDPRAEMIRSNGLKHSDEEAVLYLEHVIKNGYGSDRKAEDNFAAQLPPEKQPIFRAACEKMHKAQALSLENEEQINRDIVSNTQKGLGQLKQTSPTVTVMFYGAGHYYARNDLDEGLPGVSVAIMRRPGDPGFFNGDFPEYAFYTESNRLEKLDTLEKQAEFLGIPAKSYQQYLDFLARKQKTAVQKSSEGNLGQLPTQPTPPASEAPAPPSRRW